jgi:hypothetical protein
VFCFAAARASSQSLTGPAPGARRFDGPTRGTHEFLGRGVIAPLSPRGEAPAADPSISVWCSLEADAFRRQPAAPTESERQPQSDSLVFGRPDSSSVRAAPC